MQDLSLWQGALQTRQTEAALQEVNQRVQGHALVLSPKEMHMLARRHVQVLQHTGRVEFGEGILPKLAFAFCDSPYILPAEYAATLAELMECFYHFKNETGDAVGDDALLDYMKRGFDGAAHGSVEYLRDTLLEQLAETVRFAGFAPLPEDTPNEDDEEDADGEA